VSNNLNATKKEKVMHCWEKTGLLAIWDVSKQSVLAPVAFTQTVPLFPGQHNDDVSGEATWQMRLMMHQQIGQLILVIKLAQILVVQLALL
jgi:hypothetical protein